MRVRFNEAKATQAAAVLLRRAGYRMDYLKLIKLLYLADREALLLWGRPITTDRYACLRHGPVVSGIYDLIKEEPEPEVQSYWSEHIRPSARYEVELYSEAPTDELSEMEDRTLERIYDLHGSKNKWQLRDETHELPEWRDPGASSRPIEYRDILRAGNKDEDEISAILSELESLALVEGVR